MHDGVAGVADVDIRVVGTSREVPGRTYEREPLLMISTVVHKMHARRLAQRARAECIGSPIDLYNTTDRAYGCCMLKKNRYNR